jgi:hypothetical protein
MDASSVRGEGMIWLWDADHARVLLFSKSTGAYVEQYQAALGGTELKSLKAMYVVEGEGAPAVLIWTDGQQLLSTTLTQPGAPGASPTPGASSSPGGSVSPGASPSKKP